MINILKNRYNCKVGYSGHEKGGKFNFIGLSMPRCIIFRKTYYARQNHVWGDQSASITPKTFQELIEEIRIIEDAMTGSNEKKNIRQ